MLSFSISYSDLIKFPYFADTTERGDRWRKQRRQRVKKRVTLWITLIYHKQLPFYFYVYFEGSPPKEDPQGVTLGKLPQFYMFSRSQGNISVSQNEKKTRKQKESCLHKGRFQDLCILLRLGNSLCYPSPRRTHLYENLPYNKTQNCL